MARRPCGKGRYRYCTGCRKMNWKLGKGRTTHKTNHTPLTVFYYRQRPPRQCTLLEHHSFRRCILSDIPLLCALPVCLSTLLTPHSKLMLIFGADTVDLTRRQDPASATRTVEILIFGWSCPKSCAILSIAKLIDFKKY